MKRSLLVAASTAALIVAGGGVALAQEDVPTVDACEAAVTKFVEARDAHLAAIAADGAAADARADDQAFVDAVDELNDNPEVADVAPGGAAEVPADRAALLAARTVLINEGVDAGDGAAFDASRLQLLDLIDAALLAETEAAETDAAALQTKANETDVVSLESVREDARLAAEDACDAAVPDDDVPPVVDDDDDEVVADDDEDDAMVPVYPDEAPNTGGGPEL